MGISVSGGDVNYGTKTYLFFRRCPGSRLPLPLFLYRQSLDLTGWVENLWDGRVEMEVQGREVSIREMLARIQQQRWINVADMEITEIPCEEERGFKIR
jgi:hypothetical protein